MTQKNIQPGFVFFETWNASTCNILLFRLLKNMLAWKATFLGFSLWQKYTRGVLPPLKQAVFPFSILWHSSFSIFLKEIILSKPMPAAVRRGHFARSIDRPCSQYPSNKKYLRMLYKLTLYTFVHFSVKKKIHSQGLICSCWDTGIVRKFSEIAERC